MLNEESCSACRVGAPLVEGVELSELLEKIPEWQLDCSGSENQLVRVFPCRDFVSAMDFTQRVAAIAEQQGHHPSLLTEWGRVTVRWWTHKIKGLHRNDFVMASKTNEVWKDMQDKA